MKLIIAAGALALPCMTTAAPLETPSYTMDVEYWGTVLHAEAGRHKIGDSVQGSMRVRAALAPGDYEPEPNLGDYIWNFPCFLDCGVEVDAPNRFITTSGMPTSLGANSYDRVQVFADHHGSPFDFDGIRFVDAERGPERPDGTSDFFELDLGAHGPVDLVTNDDLLQQLDVRPADIDGGGGGALESLIDGAYTYFTFALDRLRVTARVGACSP